jgi:carbon monoxide dehydrogenase subunit G
VLVPASPEVAWARLEDVPLVASCLPGLDPASLVAETDERFRARMVNTVMGISANWDLEATIQPDRTRRVLEVTLHGEDTRLNMVLDGTAHVAVHEGDVDETLLRYAADLRVEGSLAAMGGPIIRSILSDAIEQFVGVVGGQQPDAAPRPWHVRLIQRVRRWLSWRRGRACTDAL